MIGPVGSAVFVNQMTANVASVQGAHNSRLDFQNMIAQATIQEKEEKVLEVRPAEENHEVDPDREHQRDEADRETARNPKKDDEQEEKAPQRMYKLDIKV